MLQLYYLCWHIQFNRIVWPISSNPSVNLPCLCIRWSFNQFSSVTYFLSKVKSLYMRKVCSPCWQHYSAGRGQAGGGVWAAGLCWPGGGPAARREGGPVSAWGKEEGDWVSLLSTTHNLHRGLGLLTLLAEKVPALGLTRILILLGLAAYIYIYTLTY